MSNCSKRPGRGVLPNDIELYDLLAEKSSETLPGFLDYFIADSRPPKRLKRIIEPWQSVLYGLLIPLFESAAGHRGDLERKAAYVTAPRGHAKTSMLAQMAAWSLCFAKRPISITVAASDKEQSHIFLDRLAKEASHNPWLAKRLKIRNFQVYGPTGVLTVISSDAPSSSGKLDDITLLDEICWWKKKELFDVLMSGRNKRKDGIFIVISNAGTTESWQYELFKSAQKSSNWITHEVPPFSATWLDKAAIEDDRNMLLPSLYRRLHQNIWTNLQEECGFVTREQIEACVNYTRQSGYKGWRYFCAVDYGAVFDRSAACVVHAEGDEIYLDDLQIWQGTHQNRMQIKVLEDWITDKIKRYRIARLICDVYQLEALCQHFERHISVERFSFTGGHHVALAENLRSLILNKRLHIYPNAGSLALANGNSENLVDEISSLIIEEHGQRWRFQHLPGRHDDMTIVLGMGAYYAVQERQGSLLDPPLEPLNREKTLREAENRFMWD